MTYDLGTLVPLTVDVRDEDAQLTEPASITLTIEPPTGAPITPTPDNPSTGRYQYDFPASEPGRHVVRWVATSPGVAYSDVFDVRADAARQIISLADAKAHLNITSGQHDEELRGHIDAATDAVERYLGQTVCRRTVVEHHTLDRATGTLSLGTWPCLAVASVVPLDGGPVWNVDDLAVSYTGTLTVLRGARPFTGRLAVAYQAGYTIIPPAYLRAAEIVVAGLWESQRYAGAGPVPGPLGEDDQLATDAYGVAIPPRARQLLGPTAPLVG